jgi:hypothetical protein
MSNHVPAHVGRYALQRRVDRNLTWDGRHPVAVAPQPRFHFRKDSLDLQTKHSANTHTLGNHTKHCLTHRVQIWRIRWQVFDEAVMVFDEANKGVVLVGGEVVENNNGLPPRESAVALQSRELHAHNRSEPCSARQGHSD